MLTDSNYKLLIHNKNPRYQLGFPCLIHGDKVKAKRQSLQRLILLEYVKLVADCL